MAESTLDKFYNKLFPARAVLRKASGTAPETKPSEDDTSVVRKAAAEAGERMEAEKRKKKPAYEDEAEGVKPNMLVKPKK